MNIEIAFFLTGETEAIDIWINAAHVPRLNEIVSLRGGSKYKVVDILWTHPRRIELSVDYD